MTIRAHPLHWPAGWPRTRPSDRGDARFSRRERQYVRNTDGSTRSWDRKRDLTIADGIGRVLDELAALGVVDREDVVISSDVPTRLDGLPRSGARAPDDPGVAVYWEEVGTGARRVMAIDQYTTVADNLAAVAATLAAMRAIERHGGARILERAFTGFTALPPPGSAAPRAWHDVLGVAAHAPTADVRQAYRRAAAVAHPDRGGSDARMAEVNAAWAEFQRERGLKENAG